MTCAVNQGNRIRRERKENNHKTVEASYIYNNGYLFNQLKSTNGGAYVWVGELH